MVLNKAMAVTFILGVFRAAAGMLVSPVDTIRGLHRGGSIASGIFLLVMVAEANRLLYLLVLPRIPQWVYQAPRWMLQFGEVYAAVPEVVILGETWLGALFLHLIARLLGGRGSLTSLFMLLCYTRAIDFVYLPIRGILWYTDNQVGTLADLVDLAVNLWQLGLVWLSVREVYQLSNRQTWKVIVTALLVFFLLAMCAIFAWLSQGALKG